MEFLFYNDQAERYYHNLKQEFSGKTTLDDDLLVTYVNLRSQEIELKNLVREEGYRTVNVNSRGKETFQINPTYRAYLTCVAEKSKTYTKINKLLPKENDIADDGFEDF